jgi:hypothetical protein
VYTIVNNPATLTAALKLARGCYQRDILLGAEAISGATLRGAAKRYGGRYKISAQNLLSRCEASGLAISEIRGAHNKRIIVIG